MSPPNIDLTCRAHQERKQNDSLGDARSIPHPVDDVFAYLEMLFDAATDQIDSLGKLLEGERLSWFGHLPLTRAAVEASARMWQIADPAIDARERVRVGSAANVWGRSTCWSRSSRATEHSTIQTPQRCSRRGTTAASRRSLTACRVGCPCIADPRMRMVGTPTTFSPQLTLAVLCSLP